MAATAPAYRTSAFPERSTRRTRRTPVRAVPGTRNRTREKTQDKQVSLVLLARLAAVVLVVLAVASCMRIAITSATVNVLIESDTISSEITQARSAGTGLEMEQSVLTSQPALNAAAKKLGMSAPWEVGLIELGEDVVATDAAGNIVLSDTVKNLVRIQG